MMATISGLPNELLVEIWRHILQPEDIESFALASKKIHAVSGPFLLEHRELKYRFSKFDTGGLCSEISAAGLLKEITTNPHVALYVKELVINRWRERWDPKEDRVNSLLAFDPQAEEQGRHYRHTPYSEKDMKVLERAVTKAKHVFGNDNYPIERIKDGHEDPIIALLLLLVTNLESLVVEEMAVVRSEIPAHRRANFCFLQNIEYASNEADTEALRRLIEVKLYHDNTDLCRRGYKCPNLPIVKAFATLPSVKHIHVQSINECVNDTQPRLQAGSSNVETLTFNDPLPELNVMGLFELIEGFKGLKTFTYEDSPAIGFEMFWIRTALVAHAKHSLNTLIIRCDDVCDNDREQFIGSFRSFEVLKKLEIDHAYLTCVRGSQRTRLAEALPASLEELHLHDLCAMNSLRLNPLWAGQELLEDKDTYLPNLKIIVFCDDYQIWHDSEDEEELAPDYDCTTPGIADLQAACNAKGFRVEIPERRLIDDV